MGEAERGEHRCRVRRGNDCAEEHGLQPGQIEQGIRREPGEECGNDDADRAEQSCRDGNLAQSPP
jgi:hypothetical protein